MALKTIFVVAPRRKRYDPDNPGSPIVFHDRDKRHPANPAYSMPAGEVCIDEGHGIKGDPAGKQVAWEVYPNGRVGKALSEQRLYEVEQGDDTTDLQLGPDDLGSLTSLQPAQAAALRKDGFETVTDLAAELAKDGNKLERLTKVKGIGKATAQALIEELQALELLKATE